MSYPEKEETPNYATTQFVRSEMEYYNRQVSDLKKKIRLLVRILVDKKIIGAELAKSFEETATPADVLAWYEEKHKKPENPESK